MLKIGRAVFPLTAGKNTIAFSATGDGTAREALSESHRRRQADPLHSDFDVAARVGAVAQVAAGDVLLVRELPLVGAINSVTFACQPTPAPTVCFMVMADFWRVAATTQLSAATAYCAFAISTAYVCTAPCMFERKTIHFPSGVKVTFGSKS